MSHNERSINIFTTLIFKNFIKSYKQQRAIVPLNVRLQFGRATAKPYVKLAEAQTSRICVQLIALEDAVAMQLRLYCFWAIVWAEI